MKLSQYTFSFSDALTRHGTFPGDIRVAGDAKGQILECREIDPEYDGNIIARLWMPDVTGRKNSIMTLAVFFDPLYGADTVIIPEFQLAFCYQWGCENFNIDKVMSTINGLCGVKILDASLDEWQLICAAAAVCAVYEHVGRLCIEMLDFKPPSERLEDGRSDISNDAYDDTDMFDVNDIGMFENNDF